MTQMLRTCLPGWDVHDTDLAQHLGTIGTNTGSGLST